MKTQILHLIGNAHIDPVWLWQWTEGMAETFATFRSALDLMDEYPDFTFTASSAALYEWVQLIHPGMFAEIQRRVAEGRWHLAGGWWLEPDCNIPHGESFVRQGLYGQHFFLKHFGKLARVGYNVDSFGHNASLPQILVGSGLEAYVFMRPQEHEKELPGRLFWWQSRDGTQILTCRLPRQYATWADDIEEHVRACAAEIIPPLEEMICFFGVGDHGGGPTRANLENLRDLSERPDLPALSFSSLDAFFEDTRSLGKSLPVVQGELQHHATGCYSAHSGIKRSLRKTEHALMAAEKLSALAFWQAGLPYPGDIESAWKQVLFNQFHDTLGGTSIPSAYQQAQVQLNEAASIAERNTAFAAQALALQANLPLVEGSQYYLVFNPHAWQVQTGIEIEPGHLDGDECLFDSAGQPVTTQQIQAESAATFRHRLCFCADLPPLGYQAYRLQLHGEAAHANLPIDQQLSAGATWLENNFLRVEFDPETGFIASLLDKRDKRQVFAASAPRLVVIDDPSDTWSHDVPGFHNIMGEFHGIKVQRSEVGPVRATIRAVSQFGASTLTQDFTLYAGENILRVSAHLDWHEQHKLLKLAFPGNLHTAHATFEIAYGWVERPTDGKEESAHAWVDLSGNDPASGEACGFSLLNDSKYSFDVLDQTLSMTVLRSPVYSHHNPYQLQTDQTYSYMEQGEQHFAYAILPHAGSWKDAGTVRRAAEFNQPSFVLPSGAHPGNLPARVSFICIEPENFLLSVAKKAEDSDDLILRILETHGRATNAIISLPQWQRMVQASFNPGQIKTFRLPANPHQPIIETDLLER
jgi:alpha-mannosidase